jgi:uncharacterized alpha-E superfamily protein
MLSRAADAIYWMSRYVERADNISRFVNVNLVLSLDNPGGMAAQWMPLVITTGDRKGYEERYGEATRNEVMHFLTFDLANPNSILSCLCAARENARSVQEIITQEMWEAVNRFYHFVNNAAKDGPIPRDPHGFYSKIRDFAHLFNGVTDGTLSHGEAWSFARVGRLLERADKTSRILDVKYFILLPKVTDVGSPIDSIQWSALLKSAAALHMYRQKHQRISPDQVAEFLIFDRQFPRSIRHCIIKAEESLHAITGSPLMTFRNPAEQRLGRLRSELDYSGIDEIISTGLHEYLDAFQTRLNQVGDEIFNTFFAVRPIDGAVTCSSPSEAASTNGSSTSDLLSGHASA